MTRSTVVSVSFSVWPSYGLPFISADATIQLLRFVVANAIFDRHRKFAFVVSGRFDLDQDGDFELDGRERIQALVEEWGGRVVSELSETKDFVVVGQQPAIPLVDPGRADPNDRQRVLLAEQALARFNALKQDARVLSIPVLTQAQFQAFIGYTTQDALPTRF